MPVEVRRLRFLRGANWFADMPAIVTTVRGSFDSATWPEVIAALDALLPQGVRSAFRTTVPQAIGGAVEAIAGELCAWAGFPPAPLEGRGPGEVENVAALPFDQAPLASAVFGMAGDLLTAVELGRAREWPDDARARLAALREVADAHLTASRRYVARAAGARGIPWRTLTTSSNTIVLGEGRFARRFDGAGTWRTSMIAVRIAGSKSAGNRALARAGVPVARQLPLASRADAVRALTTLGLPMVIKPNGGRRQQGVSFVFQPDQLDAAYARSSAVDSELLAESWLPGKEYRVLVIEGEIASAVENEMAQVTGDGRSTIEQLIATANAGGRRGPRELGYVQCPIPLDALAAQFLSHQGMSLQTILAVGRTVSTYPLPMLRFGGGFKREVIETIHPDTRDMLLRAPLVLDLDVAGIDLRTPDIGQSWRAVGAGICEVNPQPSLTVHYNVIGDNGRDVAGILLDRMYPPAMRGRLTHVIIVTDGDRTATARSLVGAIAATGRRVALVDARGADLSGYRPSVEARSWQQAQVFAIEDPTLDAAVHLTTAVAIVRGGLGIAQADVLLVEPASEPADRQMRAVLRSAQRAGAAVIPMPPSDDAIVRDTLSRLRLEAPGRR